MCDSGLGLNADLSCTVNILELVDVYSMEINLKYVKLHF